MSASLYDDKNKPVNLTITSEAYTKSVEYKKFRPEFFENTEENLQFAMQEAFHHGNLKANILLDCFVQVIELMF